MPTNIRLSCKSCEGANTLAYKDDALIMTLALRAQCFKSLYDSSLGILVMSLRVCFLPDLKGAILGLALSLTRKHLTRLERPF